MWEMPDSTQTLPLDENLQQPSFLPCLQGEGAAPAAASDAQTQQQQIALPWAHTQDPDLNMTSSHFFSIRTLQNTTSLNPTNISTKKKKPQKTPNVPASLESAVVDKWNASVCFPAMLQQAAVMQHSPLTNTLLGAAHSQKPGFWQSHNHLLQKCSSCWLHWAHFWAYFASLKWWIKICFSPNTATAVGTSRPSCFSAPAAFKYFPSYQYSK